MTANETYQTAYQAHYKQKDYIGALNKYFLTIKDFPESNEARYAAQQLENLKSLIDFEAVTVDDAVIDTYSAYMANIQSKREQELAVANQVLRVREEKQKIALLFQDSYRVPDYLCVNNESRKWALVDGDEYGKVYDYSDLLSFEVSENGKTIQSGRDGSAALGALLFGVTGAIVGAAGAKEMVEYVHDLHINIVVNDITAPAQIIKIISKSTPKSSQEYKAAISACEKISSALQFILSNNKQALSQSKEKARAIYAFSVADEISKFKALADEGTITLEEFQTQKAKLLALDY